MNSPDQTKTDTRDKSVTPTRRVSALLGFLLKIEVDAIFKQQPFETEDGSAPLELWRKLDTTRPTLPPLKIEKPTPLPATLDALVHEIKSRETYRRFYESQADYTFASVPVESLLAPQWYADLDYIDQLVSQIHLSMTLDEQLRFAVSEGRIPKPVVAGNQVLFTSPRRDLFAENIPRVRETEDGNFEITVRAGSRPNYIQVAQFRDRLVLVNGTHKVCALQKRGFKDCVCLLRNVAELPELGLAQSSMFRDQVLLGARPALVSDFFNPSASVQLKKGSQYQVLQLLIQVGEINPPALPS